MSKNEEEEEEKKRKKSRSFVCSFVRFRSEREKKKQIIVDSYSFFGGV